MQKRLIAVFLIVLSLVVVQAVSAEPENVDSVKPGVAARRASHLRRGIGLSSWFTFHAPDAYTEQHFKSTITAKDIALIRSIGFDHVRLPVDPRPMFHPGAADRISGDYLGLLDAAVKMILDQGLAVEIDIHESSFNQKLAADDRFVEQFADFWRALAKRYSSLDPDRVFFEILNEPEIHDAYRWYGIEAKIAEAIREGAPRHTLIAAGANYSDDDDLLFLIPLRDPNVIYNFHFYEPHLFTHQGATWGENFWHFLSGLSYPSDPENARKAAELVPDPAHRLRVIRYGQDRWNAARMDADIGQVAAWARRWNVPVICDEFGANREASAPKDRAQWISDLRATLENYGIGWAMWDYGPDGFGLVHDQGGLRVPDEIIVRALGLKVPAAPAAR